jgi:alkane 1-monooxygenase
MRAVRRAGFTVVGADVYDLRRFAAHHPGGDFLRELVGRDGTFALDNAHGSSEKVRGMLGRFWVGPFAESTRDPVDRDYLALRDELRREGWFTYGRRRIAFDVARWAVLFTAAVLLHGVSHLASFVALLAGTIDVVWWIHDAGHDAVFEDERITRRVIDALGVLVLGMPQQGYHFGVHRIHHGFPNVIGVDRALETGPLSWTEESAAQKPALFRRGRLAQWFLGIIPLAGPALLVSAIAYSWKKRQRALLVLLAARWIAISLLALSAGAPEIVLAPWAAGSVLAFMAGLNHFHLPMSKETPESHVRAIFERTQNIHRAGRFWRWLSGGLDLHIEHHLFPTMASHRYDAVSGRVRALAARHGLVYRTTSRSGAVRNLVSALWRPLGGAREAGPGLLETTLAVVVRGVAVLLPVLVALGVTLGGAATFVGPIVVFGLLSVVELVLSVSGAGARSGPGESEPSVLGAFPRAQLWIYAIGHLLVVPYVVALVARGALSPTEMLGAGLSLASMGGTVGGLGGHELMHKRSRASRALGIAVYAMSNYGHFVTSHIGGHHVNVGLRRDWGTARRGETIYAFLWRAVVHGYVGGLRIEGARLARRGRSPWSLRNFVVSYSIFVLATWALLGLFGGVLALGFFVVVSLLTIAFMELFNYISHYALERPEPGSKDRSAIGPEHTWESNNKVVNWFIFNAGMHCHHHQKPAHGFEGLTLFHRKDYIPHGIALMALISFVPPLYLRTMERILGARPGQEPTRARLA